jgi:large repetitive protein
VPDANETDIYMVRAVKLQQSPSGSYFNLGQGVFSRDVLSRQAVNFGGDDVSGQDGVFVEDNVGGTVVSTNSLIGLAQANIPPGTPMGLFQTAKTGLTSLTFDVVDGVKYGVRLYFAEIDSVNVNSASDRVFDVAIDGVTVLDNFDIYAQAGMNAGIVKTFAVTTSSEEMTISLTAITGSTLISAIEVFQIEPTPFDV